MRPLFIDVELSRNGALHGFAAIGPDGQEVVAERAAEVPGALRAVARWEADVLVGHNLAAHDRPWLARYQPGHPALALPFVDTLVLSPLAFPERPYHRLLKEHRLVRESRPAPLADCRATRELLADELASLSRQPESLGDWTRAVLAEPRVPGANPGYALALGGPAPRLAEALPALRLLLANHACAAGLARLAPDPALALPLAYVAAWMRVPPGSCLPAWTRLQHPATVALLDALRGPAGCGDCAWCARQTPEGWLATMFGYPAFRPLPAAADGTSLQRAIVQAGMLGSPLYAILPTGTGKSLCFQVPAAARHRATGALTVVVSPLQSLMKDQVDQLRARDPHAATVNGSLTLPERNRALADVREGFTSLLYVSPEQLRNPGVRRALQSRALGAWVIDEAHCLAEWGHDFRTDYLYIPRFARELAAAQGVAVPPVQCFTGTSQVAVTEEIRGLLRVELGQELLLFDGGTERSNLELRVEAVPAPRRTGRLLEWLEQELVRDEPGAAIVFAPTRAAAEVAARRLADAGWAAAAYHAGLEAQHRREVQDRFLGGQLQVIAATSAFGMGVDKPDVRLVVHLGLPGSLEAYLQQAGRAGRDGDPARCVLFFEPGDVDEQFRLAATLQLTLRDLQRAWRGLRRVPARRDGELEERVVTLGELERLDEVSASFDARDMTSHTRLAAALAWLERARLFKRDENHTRVFQGKPIPRTLADARATMDKLGLAPPTRATWEAILSRLYAADDDDGLSADDLADLDGEATSPLGAGSRVLATLAHMVNAGLLSSGVRLSAFVARGVADSSLDRARRVVQEQRALLDALPELAAGEEVEGWLRASPQRLAAMLREQQGLDTTAERVTLLLQALCRDGKGLTDQEASLELRPARRLELAVKQRRPWAEMARLGRLRNVALDTVAQALDALAAELGQRGDHVLVGFELGKMAASLRGNLFLAGELRDAEALAESTLLLLHDARAITLQAGLAVFRQAMVIRRERNDKSQLLKDDVQPLLHHQQERRVQVHVAARYASLGAEAPQRARALARDWFTEPRPTFLARWFPGEARLLERPTTPESVATIAGQLDDAQRAVVTAPPMERQLVLAGPGSGKTRVLVHRVAWLLRAERVRSRGILACCYTRANALEMRRRLHDLVGTDARGVTVTTIHGLALRILGRTPEAGVDFDGLLADALAVLAADRDDEHRDAVLGHATHLLVDEYQDLDEPQARLVEAIAGRTHPDSSQRLAVLAVGDDDQAVYGFRNGSERWIREFGESWKARTYRLLHNYRCPAPVVAAAETVVEGLRGRLKAGHTLGARGDGPPVRRWVVPPGRTGEQVLACLGNDREGVAILARTRAVLGRARAALEAAGIPASWPLDHEDRVPTWSVREVVRLRGRLEALADKLVAMATIEPVPACPWTRTLHRWWLETRLELGDEGDTGDALLRSLRHYIATEGGDRRVGDGVFLGTLHGAKGLEWPRVILLDDGEGKHDDEARRLWYVGITRASRQLDLVLDGSNPQPLLRDLGELQAPVPRGPGAPRRRYGLLGLGQLWIDWLGRHADHPAHAVLEALPVGAELTLGGDGGALLAGDTVVARLSRDEVATWAARRATFRLVAVVQRRSAQSGEAYRAPLECEHWWVPVCEGAWEG